VSGDAVHQPTWPLLLKIEHVVKLQVLGNNCNGIYFKIAGWVDLDMPHIFAILKLTFISYSF
jgi:hypothetical protein